jgi:hypothetical protein
MHSESDDIYDYKRYIETRKQKKALKHQKSKKIQNGSDNIGPQQREPALSQQSSRGSAVEEKSYVA